MQTANWMLGDIPSDWTRYRVTYAANAQPWHGTSPGAGAWFTTLLIRP